MGNLLFESVTKKYNVYHHYSADQQWEMRSQQSQSQLYKLVKNKKNPQIQGQLYELKEINQLENCLKTMQFRFQFTESQIVGVHGIYSPLNNQFNQTNFCGKIQSYSIVTYHTTHCLSDLGQIQFKDAIFMMENALKGAKLIKEKLNIKTIYDENMIFFDEKKNCKIWLNTNVSANIPRFDGICFEEDVCVNSILSSFEQKIRYSQDFQAYRKTKASSTILTFQQAIKLVKFLQHRNQFQQKNKPSYRSQIDLQNFKIKTSIDKQNISHKKSLSVKKTKKQDETGLYFSARKQNSNPSSHIKEISNKYSGQNPVEILYFKSKLQNSKRKNLCFQNTFNNTKKSILKDQLKKFPLFHDEKAIKQLKKRIIKKDEVKEKFLDSRVKEAHINSKPSSAISTHYDSTQVHQNYFPLEKYGHKIGEIMKPINFTKRNVHKLNFVTTDKETSRNLGKLKTDEPTTKDSSVIQNLIFNFYSDRKEWIQQNLKKGNTFTSDQHIRQSNKLNSKISITSETSRLKKQLSMPSFQRIHPLLSA